VKATPPGRKEAGEGDRRLPSIAVETLVFGVVSEVEDEMVAVGGGKNILGA
jgi:hypothetical protein